jgi:hypothetical protein
MTRPLVALYWVKSNGRNQNQPHIPSRNEENMVAETHQHQALPQTESHSRWHELHKKLRLSHR